LLSTNSISIEPDEFYFYDSTTNSKWSSWNSTSKRFEFNDDLYSSNYLLAGEGVGLLDDTGIEWDGGTSFIFDSTSNKTILDSNLNVTGEAYVNSTERVCTAENGLCNQTTTAIIQGSEETVDSTTSTSYVQSYRFSPTLEVALYKIDLSFELTRTQNSLSTSNAEGRVQIDDTTEVTHGTVYDDINGLYDTKASVYFYNCTSSGTHNFDFDMRTDDGTVSMRRKRIVLTKVSE